MDYLLLKLTALMLRQAPSRWRMLCGTLIASLIILLLFTPLSSIFNFFIGKILYSMLIILVVFRYQSITKFLSAVSLFYLSAFMVGGGLFAIHYFFQNQISETLSFVANASYGDPISWLLILLGFPVMWVFSRTQVNEWVVRNWKYNEHLSLVAKIDSETIMWKGKVDSGNACKDPITQGPVLFVQKASLPPSLKFLANVQPMAISGHLDMDTWPEEWRKRLTIIPFRTISQDIQYAPAIKADLIYINRQKEVLAFSNFYIMVSQVVFSSEETLDCLLHPDMVLKAMKVEAVS